MSSIRGTSSSDVYKRQQVNTSNQELIFFITPRIIQT